MLACTETITLIRGSGIGYTCQSFSGCSWFNKTGVVEGSNGLTPSNTVSIRIPSAALAGVSILPEPGDHVVKGTVISVATPAELAAYHPRKVLTVGDNRRGKFPHLAVIGK